MLSSLSLPYLNSIFNFPSLSFLIVLAKICLAPKIKSNVTSLISSPKYPAHLRWDHTKVLLDRGHYRDLTCRSRYGPVLFLFSFTFVSSSCLLFSSLLHIPICIPHFSALDAFYLLMMFLIFLDI